MSTNPLLQGAGRLIRAEARRQRWFSDPALFAREAIDWPEGEGLIGYQAEILSALATSKRVAVRAPHGAAKTATAALAILHFAVTRDSAGIDWKILTTAGGWRQLSQYLWPEVHRWERLLRWDELGLSPWRQSRESFDLGLKLSHGEAFAAASDNPALIEGAHADAILVIADEAKSISGETFNAIEGALSGKGESFALAVSTPGPTEGRFFEVCSRRPGLADWHPIHISLDEAIQAGRISPEWADARRRQWGESSSVYQNRVLGEFSSGDADSLIPLSWVEAANEGWSTWDELGRPQPSGRLVVGVDVARFGSDQTVLVSRRGDVVLAVEKFGHQDTMATVGEIALRLTNPSDVAIIDEIGVGGGVLDRLRERRKSCLAFNASSASSEHDNSGELGFLNQRAAAWWALKQLLDPAAGATLRLPPDDELIGDLVAPRWKMTSSGRIQLEGKEEIRRRLGRSPDVGDAVAMAFTIRSGPGPSGLDVDMAPVAMDSLFARDPAWGSGPLFTEPREYPNVERVEGPEADRFPGPDDPPAKRVPRGGGGVW